MTNKQLNRINWTRSSGICLIIIICLFMVGQTLGQETGIQSFVNPESGTYLGMIKFTNEAAQVGIFVYDANGSLVLSMLEQDIRTASFSHTGRYLVAYHETGQALYELPDGRHQMQLNTKNGSLAFSYIGNTTGTVRNENLAPVFSDILIQQDSSGLYSLYLVSMGELRVIMGSNIEGGCYSITFTGVPGLDPHVASCSEIGM